MRYIYELMFYVVTAPIPHRYHRTSARARVHDPRTFCARDVCRKKISMNSTGVRTDGSPTRPNGPSPLKDSRDGESGREIDNNPVLDRGRAWRPCTSSDETSFAQVIAYLDGHVESDVLSSCRKTLSDPRNDA